MGDRLTQLQDAVDEVCACLQRGPGLVRDVMLTKVPFAACAAVCRLHTLRSPTPQPRDPRTQR